MQPIAGFLSGVETIASITRDIQCGSGYDSFSPKGGGTFTRSTHASQGVVRSPTVSNNIILDSVETQAKLQNVLSTVDNVMHIHSFMLMTINRCIDFAKSSNGDKLVPRLLTVDLHEVFSLPVKCMKEMQVKVRIDAPPVPDNICTHIITG
jgi:hypothetical protein